MRWTRSSAVLTAAGFLWAVPATSHHAFSVAFDLERPLSIEGIVAEVKWENPHSWIFVDAKRPDGTVEQWRFETQPPNTLRRTGVTASMLKPGITVTIKGYGSQDRASLAAAASGVLFANRESFRISAGGTPPPKEGQ
jgi:hypothetical protein